MRPSGCIRSNLRCRVRAGVRLLAALLVAGVSLSFAGERACAQSVGNLLHFPARPRAPKPVPPSSPAMLVQAAEIRYDYANNTVAAVGNVQIYYNGATIEADKVTYDQKTKRLVAEGNVRLTEADGKITYGQFVDLTDDYRDGFVDSLRIETVEDTRFAATRADRDKGTYTIMQNGVYTACEPCKDDPKKPPLWQVRAARIIRSEGEKMIYFEDAIVDFFGVPLVYIPFMSAPDPTVKRKSGFLFPAYTETAQYGLGVKIPYYWALAPSYDMTFATVLTTKQGALLEGEWRQRLMDGSYTIRAAGIFQLDPGFFAARDGADSPTANTFRGVIQTAGQFALSDKWTWGWNGLLMTDTQFLFDYELSQITSQFDPFHTGIAAEGVSQLYLVGAGDRSYFDIRSVYYYGFSELDIQRQIPIIHPVLDYSNVVGQQVMGGELSYKFNLTSLTRELAEFDPINANAAGATLCSSGVSSQITKSDCLLRGVPGTYTRSSGEVDWRRTFTTDNGQVITPFLSARADLGILAVDNQPGVANYLPVGESNPMRAMPAAGVEYRYPFINVEPWGTQTIEPIAQLILRPNETAIGKFPNEDAQSMVFSTANLFSLSKFSGWDRDEGGGRVNAGFQYTAQFNQAGTLTAVAGQSYQVFGLNSYAAADLSNTGLESGLDKTFSDYVASVTYQPNSIYSFAARGRFSSGGYDAGLGKDVAEFTPERLEFETRANFDRWTLQLLYGDYAPQPEIGFLFRREEIMSGASFKITPNWLLLGSIRYDLAVHEFDQTRVGIAYVDDCFMLSLNYLTYYTYTGVAGSSFLGSSSTNAGVGTPYLNNTFVFSFSLRTLGPDALPAIGTAF